MGQRDMLLELSVLSYHRLSPRQVSVKRFDSAGGSLGRSEQADWYLPDPERVVSGVHAQISCNNGVFSITDKSTNGLFVNRAVDALGQGNSHVLLHGDVLCMGDYEIQVALIDALPDAMPDIMPAKHSAPTDTPRALAASSSFNSAAAFSTSSALESAAGLRISDVSDAPFPTEQTPNRSLDAALKPQQDQDLALDDHFLAPAAMIPDDWESAWQPAGAAVAAPVQSVPAVDKAAVNPVGAATSQHECLQAFLQGLGVTENNPQALNSTQWWQQLGQALQQSLQGVIAVMRERSNVKNSFRVNQTTFQQRENNPLKFSANLDDAFHNLFNRQGASFMQPRQAIAEAFADISQHESAIIAGAAGAMQGLLAELAPEKLEASDFGGGFVDKVNPAQRQARLWARYKALHRDLTEDMKNKNKQGVNDDFINAYEAYLRTK